MNTSFQMIAFYFVPLCILQAMYDKCLRILLKLQNKNNKQIVETVIRSHIKTATLITDSHTF